MTTFAEMSLVQRIDALTTAIRGHGQAATSSLPGIQWI